MFICNFEILGRTNFPVDMLRYDHCHPADDAAVSIIGSTTTPTTATTIRLTKCANTKRGAYPTQGRWESFGWRILTIHQPYKVS